MPPRFAYWTILIDNGPTAFRARDPEELLPTLNQLKRTNRQVTMKWFSGGKLWNSPDEARQARRPPQDDRRQQRAQRHGADRQRPTGSRPRRRPPTLAASRRRKRRDDEPPDRG